MKICNQVLQSKSSLSLSCMWHKKQPQKKWNKLPKLFASLSPLSLQTLWQSWSHTEYFVCPPTPLHRALFWKQCSFSDQCSSCWWRWTGRGHATQVLAFFQFISFAFKLYCLTNFSSIQIVFRECWWLGIHMRDASFYAALCQPRQVAGELAAWTVRSQVPKPRTLGIKVPAWNPPNAPIERKNRYISTKTS